MSVISLDSDAFDSDIDLSGFETNSVMDSNLDVAVAVPQYPTHDDEELAAIFVDVVSVPSKTEATVNIELLSIKSLLDMVRLLPRAVLEDGVYRIRGSLSDEDRERIQDYASRVGELAITDNVNDDEAKLAPNTFLRIAQLHSHGQPLFPSLYRLIISDLRSSVDNLPLFLSPSLRILEITGVSESSADSFLDFVANAVDVSPELESLTMGRGHLRHAALTACLQFANLRCLKFDNATAALDWSFLEEVGCLECLEELVFDARLVFYTPSAALIKADAEDARRRVKEAESRRRHEEERIRKIESDSRRKRLDELRCATGEDLAAIQNDLRIMKNEQWLRTKGGVPCLEESSTMPLLKPSMMTKRKCRREWCRKTYRSNTATIKVCTPCLKNDVKHIETKESGLLQQLEDLDARYPEDEEKSSWKSMDRSRPPTPNIRLDKVPALPLLCDLSRVESAMPVFKKISSLTICGSVSMMRDIIERTNSCSLKVLVLELADHPTPSTWLIPEVEQYANVIDFVAHHWAGTMTHVSLHSYLGTFASILPMPTIQTIIGLSQLEHLDISGWSLDSGSSKDMRNVLETQEKLRTIHLPGDVDSPGIPLSHLEQIASSSPSLKSLRCRISELASTPIIPRLSSTAPSHNLETLGVGNAELQTGIADLLGIAVYIDTVFPNLISLETLEGPACEGTQWGYVHLLIKMCQDARRVERNRLSHLAS